MTAGVRVGTDAFFSVVVRVVLGEPHLNESGHDPSGGWVVPVYRPLVRLVMGPVTSS